MDALKPDLNYKRTLTDSTTVARCSVSAKKKRRNRRLGKLHCDEVQEPPGMTSKSFDWLPVDSYSESYEKAISLFVCLVVF